MRDKDQKFKTKRQKYVITDFEFSCFIFCYVFLNICFEIILNNLFKLSKTKNEDIKYLLF